MWTPLVLRMNCRQCVFLAQSFLVAGVLLVFCKYWMDTFQTLLFKACTLCLLKFRNNNIFLILVQLNFSKTILGLCVTCYRQLFICGVNQKYEPVLWWMHPSTKLCPSSHKQTVELCRAPANLMTDLPGTAESSGCRVWLDANAAWHLHPCLNNPCYPEWASATAN